MIVARTSRILPGAMAKRKKARKVASTKRRSASKPTRRKRTRATAVARTKARAPARTATAKPARKAKPRRAAVRAKKKSAAGKGAAPKKASARSAARAKPLRRREDRAGHLDPRYVAELRSRSNYPPSDPDGFITRPRATDGLVEELGEEYVASATAGESGAQEMQNQDVPEEVGGPFVHTTGAQEFAGGTDASNPKNATREPFPRT